MDGVTTGTGIVGPDQARAEGLVFVSDEMPGITRRRRGRGFAYYLPDGGFFMPMFVQPAAGCTLDDALKQTIADALKTQCSPRHVPDEIHAVDAIPYTLTGKKLEVPVRKILMGADPTAAVSRDAMQNPAAIDTFVRFAAGRRPA